jgi:hypothetical protein
MKKTSEFLPKNKKAHREEIFYKREKIKEKYLPKLLEKKMVLRYNRRRKAF